MSDVFHEHLVKRQKKSSEQVLKVVMIIFSVLLVAAGLVLHPLMMVPALALLVVDYFIFPRFDMEYEYQYVNGEIDVDAIYGRSRRKRLGTIGAEGIECIAPLGSHHLDRYNVGYKVVDYSSLDPAQKPYVIVKGAEKTKYYLNLSEAMANDLRYRMPRIFFKD